MASRVVINITAKDEASKAFAKVAAEAESMGHKIQSAGKSMMKAGGVLTAAVTVPIVAGMKAAADAARESEKIAKVTEQVIRSTGGAAKVTIDDVDRLATALSNKTAIDDEVIMKGQQVMLTFTKIRNEAGKGNDIFNRASAAMLDLGTVFGSTDAAAMQLGKALNDPVKGITALGRAGVSFTAEQKKMIKGFVEQGDILSAQKIILAEVETQVGGTAAASATAYDRMRVALGNLQESFGKLLLPMIERASAFVADLAAKFDTLSPGMQKAIVIALAVAAAIGPIVTVVGALVTAIGFLISPIGLVVVAIAALVAGAIYAYRHFEGFREVVDRVVAVVRGALPQALEWLRSVWTSVVEGMRQAWARWGDDVIAAGTKAVGWFQREVIPALQSIGNGIRAVLSTIARMWEQWGDDVLRFARAAIEGVLNVVRPLMSAIQNAITAVLRAIRGDWSGAWEELKSTASNAKDAIVAAVQGLGKLLFAAMQAAWTLLESAWNAGRDKVVAAAKALPGKIVAALGDLGSLLLEAGKDIVRGLIKGVESMFGAVANAGKNLAGKIKGAFTAPLRIFSPSKVFEEYGGFIVEGLVLGIERTTPEAEKAMLSLADKIVGNFENSVSSVRSAYGTFRGLGQAQESLVEAQETLNETRMRASTIADRLAAAEARVEAAKVAGGESTDELRDAERELKELREEAARLPKDMKTATDRLTEAQERLADAQMANFDAGMKLAQMGPNAIDMWRRYAEQAGISRERIDAVANAANAVTSAVNGIPSYKQIVIETLERRRVAQYEDPTPPGGGTIDPGTTSNRRIEPDGSEYIWIEGIGWVRQQPGGVRTGYQVRAKGGPVSAGRPYIVGEQGPELFMPSSSGRIVPNGASMGGVVIEINVAGSVVTERQLGDVVARALVQSGQVRPDGSVVVRR